MSAARIVFVVALAILIHGCSGGDERIGTGATLLNAIGYKIKQLSLSWSSVPGADTYRLLENPDGVTGYSQIGADLPSTTTTFDHDIAVHLQDWANASYILQSCMAGDCVSSGARFATDSRLAIGYFKASNTDFDDNFGQAVAVSDDGNTLAVGAWEEDGVFPGSGAVYVFTREAGVWQGPVYLKASNAGNGDQFGYSLALSGDGLTLAVGAWQEAGNGTGQSDDNATGAGAVYLFVRAGVGSVWTQQAYIKASNAEAGDNFGQAVTLSDDGNTLVVGATGEDSAGSTQGEGDNSASGAGAVYTFTRSAAVWSQQVYLKASDAAADDGFGNALSISADGSVLAVGASHEDDGANTNNGAAYVFSFAAATGWSEDQVLHASNAGTNDNFGASLALSGDGVTLAVGAPGEDSDGVGDNEDALDSGAVYVFTDSAGWNQPARIKPAFVEAGDQFGFSVAIGGAGGDILAAGANREDGAATAVGGDALLNTAPLSGAGYAFTRDAAGVWEQQAYLKATNTELGDSFGSAMAMSGDGKTLAVGAINEDSAASGIAGPQGDNSTSNSGAVYLY